METIQHRWLQHQGKQLYWCDLDNQERWQDNMKNPTAHELLKDRGWDQLNAITYNFNSHGFRCDEFSQEPGIITLGCSFTGGIALPVDRIWPTLVARRLNLKLWNLGVGSASMDSCFRLLNHYILKLNVRMVLILTPLPNRFEMFMPNDTIEWAVPNGSNFNNYQKAWYQNDKNSTYNYIKNSMAIKHLCYTNNIKLVEKSGLDDLIELPGTQGDLARDLQHPGAVRHSLCADLFLNAV